MNTLINRFFTKDEPANVELENIADIRHSLLKFLINQGSNTAAIEQLTERVTAFEFPENEFLADLSLVQHYLELERYLIFKDPRYISSEKRLRDLVRGKFPKLTQNDAFFPLFLRSKNQEIALALHFLKYVVQAFEGEYKSQKLAFRWSAALQNTSLPKKMELIEQINMLKKLSDTSLEMHTEFVSSFGNEWVDGIFEKCHEEFVHIYRELKTIESINDLLPNGPKKNSGIEERNVIQLNGTKSHQRSKQVLEIDKKSILENILDGFLIFDRNARIVDFNKNALNTIGIKEEELTNLTVLDILPEDLSSELKKDLQKDDESIPSNVIGRRFETILKKWSGDSEDFELSFTNNYTEKVDTYSLFLKNITNKKDSLKEISEARINAERTAKAKSTFLSNMSHEIRTPLNVILGLSEIIKKSDLSNQNSLRKNVEGIDFSAKNLLSIVNDILDFSKIEAGKLSIQAIDFNLRKIVDSLADGFEIKAREKGIKLTAKMDDGIPEVVVGDQYRLNQILNNLIGNAIKFTQAGEISINIEMISTEEDEVRLLFKVKDTGIGIEKQHLERIFDSFYQVENTENSKATGTGLGLAITKELIHLQNGSFEASSIIDEGSVFEFTLPFKRSKLKGISSSVSTYERKVEKLEGLRVLVAEDNQMNQFYIKQLLKNLNVQVDIAENGKEAIEIFRNSEFDYDLILMDMHMPIVNGIEAITSIRKSNRDSLKKVPIVACSADVFPEARKNAIKAGIDFYLTKPLNEDAVKEVLFWLISDEEFDPNVNIDERLYKGESITSKKQSVDINLLKENFDNDEEFIITLLDVFIKETPEDYKSLRQCMEREYYARASSLAHKMKSSFMNLGMTAHGHHLQLIESNLIKKEGLPKAKKHFEIFNKLYTRALLDVNMLLIEMKQK